MRLNEPKTGQIDQSDQKSITKDTEGNLLKITVQKENSKHKCVYA